MPVSWWELQLEVPAELADAVASFLFDEGSTGLETAESSGGTVIKAYFRSDPPIAALQRFWLDLRTAGIEAGEPSYRSKPLAEEDWAESWKQHFQPLSIGRRLHVSPPWQRGAPADRLPIVIDPGMAFGTGQHATTRACLELIEDAVDGRPLARALDIGTGSGILAIALCKLGARQVYAVDIDERACELARSNSAVNGCGDTVIVASCWSEVPGTFDLIVANLFTNALLDLAARVQVALRPGGRFICSGFSSEDEGRIAAHYGGLRVCRRHRDGFWAALAMEWREV